MVTNGFMIKRLFDLVMVIFLIILFCLPILLIALLVKTTSSGSIIYWSDRVGRNNKIFRMPKFRTMKMDTPPVATHLLSDSVDYLTVIGGFLRRASLDELPQLWNILKGEMSLVGPRPALFNQYDLISMREKCGVDAVYPGLTGWAQVNGRDELLIIDKVKLDEEYVARQSFVFDLHILWKTVIKVLRRDGVVH